MAKAKNTETTDAGEAAAKKKPAKAARKPVRQPPAAASGATPLVDTGLAASNAARTLAARAKLGLAASTPQAAGKESGSFKQLRESLNKPAAHVVTNTIGGILGGQKSNQLGSGYGQVFHNQVQGGPKFNVPRRTNG